VIKHYLYSEWLIYYLGLKVYVHVFYLILETHGERVVIRIGVMNRTKGTCLFQAFNKAYGLLDIKRKTRRYPVTVLMSLYTQALYNVH
jgi:hypothetical protein